jgi:hypothetical protein
VRFGLFYEHQLPRPWGCSSEERLLAESLDQIELADRLGFDYVWVVEHHFLEEYSHSSAPEVFLGAASQRTRRIRLGQFTGRVGRVPGRSGAETRTVEGIAGSGCGHDGGEALRGLPGPVRFRSSAQYCA